MSQGRFDQLLKSSDDFRETMLKYGMFEEDKPESGSTAKPKSKTGPPPHVAGTSVSGAGTAMLTKEEDKATSKDSEELKLKKGGLVEIESTESGLVPWRIYMYYIGSGGTRPSQPHNSNHLHLTQLTPTQTHLKSSQLPSTQCHLSSHQPNSCHLSKPHLAGPFLSSSGSSLRRLGLVHPHDAWVCWLWCMPYWVLRVALLLVCGPPLPE